jgi:hypothetical protein
LATTTAKELATIRGNTAKGLKQLANAQAELTKARVADTMDPNQRKPKSMAKESSSRFEMPDVFMQTSSLKLVCVAL